MTDYQFSCVHSVTCDVLSDQHGPECEAANQTARHEHYRAIVLTTPLGDLLPPGTVVSTDNLVEDVIDIIAPASRRAPQRAPQRGPLSRRPL